MAATLAPRAVIRAAAIAAAAMLASPSAAQDDAAADASSEDPNARQEIVTDPDLRRAEERRRRIAVLSGLFERQTRVFRISYRLLYAAVDMCEDNVRPAMGFTYANAFMFQGAVRTAASDMGLTHRVSIVEIAPGSAASRAGLRIRDQLLAIGDWPVPYGEGAVTLTQAKLRDVLVRDNRAVLYMRRDGNQFSVTLEPDFICDIKVLAVPGEPIRAYSGDDNVVVFAGLHQDLEDDNVMAAAIGREIANHLLPGMGIGSSGGSGLEWSNFFNWGFEPEPTGDVVADQSLAQDYGTAADYVGAYLMARAGFDHRKAPALWQRMAGRQSPPPEHSYGTPDPDYIQNIELAVAEIDRKLSAREPLRPETADPPMEFAAAPDPAGPLSSPEAAPQVATEVADVQPPSPPDIVPETAEAQPSPPAPAEAPPAESGDLPWLTTDTPPAADDPVPVAAPPSGTEVAGLPWASEPSQTESESAAPEPDATGITVSALEDGPTTAPSAEPASEPVQTPPIRGADNTLIPGTEPPRFAMAELGIEPPSVAPTPQVPAGEAIAALPEPIEPEPSQQAVPEARPPVAEVAPAEALPDDAPVATVRKTTIPETESPELAIAALGPIAIPSAETPADTATDETTAAVAAIPAAEEPADIPPAGAPDTVAAIQPAEEAAEPSPEESTDSVAVMPPAEEPAEIAPAGTSDTVATVRSLEEPSEPAPVETADAVADVPAQPAAPIRKLAPPPTGEAEIAVLFRNQGLPQATEAEAGAPTQAVAPDEPAARQLAAVALPDTEPPALVERSAPEAGDEGEDYDIGDLIRALEDVDEAADDKLTTPEPAATETEDLPWLSEPTDPAQAQPDEQTTDAATTETDEGPQSSLPVLPATTDADNPDLSPPAPSDSTVIDPSAIAPTPTAVPDEQEDAALVAALPAVPEPSATTQEPETPPEPIVDLVPMYAAPMAQTTQLPDEAAAPVAALPAIPERPDNETVAAPTSDDTNQDAPIDETTVESTIDLVAPAAGQSSPGADPADLGKGFSFRTWLGES